MNPHIPEIKICGVTNSRDYHNAVALGARYIGFIFYPPSPRCISPRDAAALVRRGPARHHQIVGVFVNQDIRFVSDACLHVGLDIVQLHGDENPAYISQISLPCWKAVRMRSPHSLNEIPRYRPLCSAILLDTYRENIYGGAGQQFDPQWASDTTLYSRPIILAGGVSAANLQNYRHLPLHALDINSSIESSPGVKCPARMQEFFSAFRRVFQTETIYGETHD